MIIPAPDDTPLTDDSLCPVNGKYHHWKMKDVPSHFLDWFRGQVHLMRKYPKVADYIKRTSKSIDQDLEDDSNIDYDADERNEEMWGREYD